MVSFHWNAYQSGAVTPAYADYAHGNKLTGVDTLVREFHLGS